MKGSTRDILIATIIGDALGSAFDGMGKGHIRTHFKETIDYIDPSPALKGKIHRWRKPGLYSSISQFMLILASHASRRGPFMKPFLRSIAGAPSLPGAPYGIFRGPGAVEVRLIMNARGDPGDNGVPAHPCGRIIPALAPIALKGDSFMERMTAVIGYIRLFTLDYSTIAGGLLYSLLISPLKGEEPTGGNPVDEAAKTASLLADTIDSAPATVFDTGVNPATLIRALFDVRGTLIALASAGDLSGAERIISSRVSAGLKNPVTRATVNMPGALIPYALYICSHLDGDPMLLFHTAFEGGESAALSAMVGALAARRHGPSILPDQLVRNLVNRKRILSIADDVSAGRLPVSMPEEFILSEASLTTKEIQERSAKSRHGAVTTRRPPASHREQELRLSRHVVESWTKADKAKWKRERKRMESEEES